MSFIFSCFNLLLVDVSGDRQTPTDPVPTSVLSSTTINTNPTIISSSSPPLSQTQSSSPLIKIEQLAEYPQRDLNLNVHHLNHLAQQQSRLTQKQRSISDPNDIADDDDDDDDDQNTEGNSEISNR